MIVPFWVAAPNTALIALGGFLMQFFVQGAWGVIPAHINELSPGQSARFLSRASRTSSARRCRASIPYVESMLGEIFSYGAAMGVLAAVVMIGVAVVTFFGPEAHGVSFRKSGH